MISLSNIDTLKSIFIKDVDCGDSHTTILLGNSLLYPSPSLLPTLKKKYIYIYNNNNKTKLTNNYILLLFLVNCLFFLYFKILAKFAHLEMAQKDS